MNQAARLVSGENNPIINNCWVPSWLFHGKTSLMLSPV